MKQLDSRKMFTKLESYFTEDGHVILNFKTILKPLRMST